MAAYNDFRKYRRQRFTFAAAGTYYLAPTVEPDWNFGVTLWRIPSTGATITTEGSPDALDDTEKAYNPIDTGDDVDFVNIRTHFDHLRITTSKAGCAVAIVASNESFVQLDSSGDEA